MFLEHQSFDFACNMSKKTNLLGFADIDNSNKTKSNNLSYSLDQDKKKDEEMYDLLSHLQT